LSNVQRTVGFLVAAKHGVPLVVSLGPLHGLPGGARVEGDESGQVGRPEGLLSHPLSKLASQVNPYTR